MPGYLVHCTSTLHLKGALLLDSAAQHSVVAVHISFNAGGMNCNADTACLYCAGDCIQGADPACQVGLAACTGCVCCDTSSTATGATTGHTSEWKETYMAHVEEYTRQMWNKIHGACLCRLLQARAMYVAPSACCMSGGLSHVAVLACFVADLCVDGFQTEMTFPGHCGLLVVTCCCEKHGQEVEELDAWQ